MHIFSFVFSILIIAFLIQFQLIWPAESYLLENLDVGSVSLLFIPHGIKAISVVIGGLPALFAIALAHFATDMFLSLPIERALWSAFSGSIVMLLPLLVFNFLMGRQLLSSISLNDDYRLSMVRLVIAVALVSSMLNGLLNAVYHEGDGVSLLAFRYVLGDMLGTLLALAILMIFRKSVLRYVSRKAGIVD